jgi:large subunit ribosomal protein L15
MVFMATRAKSKLRKHLGNRSFGHGNIKNRRGKGNRGGVGRAGSGKQNWFATLKRGDWGKPKGFVNKASGAKLKEITLKEISKQVSKGKFSGEPLAIELKGFKVLSNGKLEKKASIRASAFSAKAIEKIKAAGGEATVME